MYAACGAVLLAGCASMPDSGDLRGVESTPRQDSQVRVYAVPPSDDATPTQIVQGFLEALTSDDADYKTARQYLTPEASKYWRPEQSTTVLSDGPGARADREPREDSTALTYTLTGTKFATVDAQQAYAPSSGHYSELVRLVKDDKSGQWRIDAVPQGVVMGKSDFQRNYTSFNKYYFASNVDVNGSSLPMAVADPVWVRRHVDPTTRMVRSLLSGPTNWLDPVVRSSFPTGIRLRKGAGPLTPDDRGKLTVPLNDRASDVGTGRCEEMAAQLLFTLRDLSPAVEEVELRADGGQLCSLTQDGAATVATRGALNQPDHLYYLDGKDKLVRVAAGSRSPDPEPAPGALGQGEQRLRSVAVARDERTAAGVGLNGQDLFVSALAQGAPLGEPVLRSQGKTERDRLTPPSWDAQGGLWIADRDPARRLRRRGRGRRRRRQRHLHRHPVRGQRLGRPVQPQRRGERLGQLDRDDERTVPGEGAEHLERHHLLPQQPDARRPAEREREQLGGDDPDQRKLELAHGLLQHQLSTTGGPRRSPRRGPPLSPQVFGEPSGGQLRDPLQRARLAEQMRGAGHHVQPVRRGQPPRGLTVEVQHLRVRTAHHQQHRARHQRQCVASQVGASAPRDDRRHPPRTLRRRDERRRRSRTGPEQPHRQVHRVRPVLQPVHGVRQAPRQQTDVETVPARRRVLVLLRRGQQVQQQRAEPRPAQHSGDGPVARAEPRTAAAVREQHHTARPHGDLQITAQGHRTRRNRHRRARHARPPPPATPVRCTGYPCGAGRDGARFAAHDRGYPARGTRRRRWADVRDSRNGSGREPVPRARSGMVGRRYPRTGTEPVTARSPLRLRLLLASVFVSLFIAGAVLFAVWAAGADAGDSPGSGPLTFLAVVCGVLALTAALDLRVVLRRLRRERDSTD